MTKAEQKAIAAIDIVFEKTKNDMQILGVFKAEFEPLIRVYSELVVQYNDLTSKFQKSGYRYQIKTADGGAKKAPIVATLETLRKDILAYSDRLCLNPKSIESVTIEKKTKSTLASVLASMND